MHSSGLATILSGATSCLKADLEHHKEFFAKHGISPFYGDRSAFGKLSDAQKKVYLKGLGKSPSLVSELKPTSCVGLALKCLEQGFTAAGQEGFWTRLKAYAKANDLDGTSLQNGLRELGWKVLYWNPNTARNQEWDAAERKADPENKLHFWGDHEEYWQSVQKASHKYYYNGVDNYTALVNFDTFLPAKFIQVPFFIGTAHSGYHVFPGIHGHVIEGHSTRQITDPNTLENSEFNPLKDGGGPRGLYRSGIVAVPPGFGF